MNTGHSIPRIFSTHENPGSKIKSGKSWDSMISHVEKDIIGSRAGFWGPLGWTKYTYLDHTASGKSLNCIENFIQSEVLPHYANTHTTVSFTSLQTTRMRAEARKVIKQSVGASEVDDEVIFCGSGATSAVHKLLHCISYPKSRKLIVFVGPFEHHSNILPWREAASQVIPVPMDHSTGQVDVDFLRKKLKKLQIKRSLLSFAKEQLIVGCFSAGSNITGALTDDVEITQIMHESGGLAVWDYAAAAPHVDINMNPQNKLGNSFKDAIFFSGHKFLGGPQTPGVLVVKKHLLRNPVPHEVGGGTVLFTTRKEHQYLKEITEKEEGGTPNIIGSIRLGLTFRFRRIVGIQNIIEKEAILCRTVLRAWKDTPAICILGSGANPRLPIISFMIRHPSTGYFLHHNFVVALLNDFFGIQCRGGCMCAGPYAQVLLGVGDKLASFYAQQLRKTVDEDDEQAKYGGILKPGFVRLAFNFHTTDEELQFVIEAVRLISRYGWRLLPYYKICWENASFMLCSNSSLNLPHFKVTSLNSFDKLIQNRKPFSYSNEIDNFNPRADFNYAQCLKSVKRLMKFPFDGNFPIDNGYFEPLHNRQCHEFLNTKFRWFLMPYESALMLFEEHGAEPPGCRSPHPKRIIKSHEPFKLYLGGTQNNSWKVGSIPHSLASAWTNCHHHKLNLIEQDKFNWKDHIYGRSSHWEPLWSQLQMDEISTSTFNVFKTNVLVRQ